MPLQKKDLQMLIEIILTLLLGCLIGTFTEQCRENTCEGGECKTVSKVVELLPRSLLAAGISFTVAIVLFLIWNRIKRRIRK